MPIIAELSTYWAEPSLWIVAFLFILLYSCLQPWWRHAIGWTLCWVDAGMFLILTPHMLNFFFGVNDETLFFQWFVLIIFMLVPGGIMWRIFILGQSSHWRFPLPWHHPPPPAAKHQAPHAEP